MDAEHYRLRDFLTRAAQPYDWYEAGSPDAERLLEGLGLAEAALPLLVDGDERYQAATVESIARAWGAFLPAKQKHYDFVVAPGRPVWPHRSTRRRTVSRRLSATTMCPAASRPTRR